MRRNFKGRDLTSAPDDIHDQKTLSTLQPLMVTLSFSCEPTEIFQRKSWKEKPIETRESKVRKLLQVARSWLKEKNPWEVSKRKKYFQHQTVAWLISGNHLISGQWGRTVERLINHFGTFALLEYRLVSGTDRESTSDDRTIGGRRRHWHEVDSLCSADEKARNIFFIAAKSYIFL